MFYVSFTQVDSIPTTLVDAKLVNGAWKEKVDRRTIRKCIFSNLTQTFQKSKKCGRCQAYRKEQQLSGWGCDRCGFEVQILLKTGSLAIANAIRYIYQRRVEGKRQLERIDKLTPERRAICTERLRFPDITRVNKTAIGRAINKRRAPIDNDFTIEPANESKKRKISVLPTAEGEQGQ